MSVQYCDGTVMILMGVHIHGLEPLRSCSPSVAVTLDCPGCCLATDTPAPENGGCHELPVKRKYSLLVLDT